MKRCPYCGVEYPDSELFCPADREELIDPSASTQQSDKTSPHKRHRTLHSGGVACILIGALQLIASALARPHNDKTAKILVITIALVAVFLIAIGIYLNLEKADRDKDSLRSVRVVLFRAPREPF